jgi:error-prone DNA polymerase
MSVFELQAASAFSFGHGASHAEELVQTASALGLAGLAVADRNTLSGVVRAHQAAKSAGLRFIPAARLVFRDGTPDITCAPTDRAAWGRLSRLISRGKHRTVKGDCALDLPDLLDHADGQAILIHAEDDHASLPMLSARFRNRAWLAAKRRYAADDARRLRALAACAARHRLPLLATNDVLYHAPERRPLQDVMTCIRLGTTLDQAGLALAANAERHLKSPTEMARLFRDHPEAIAATADMASLCRFSLDELSYEYPDEPVPAGTTPDAHLAALTWQGAAQRYPAGLPDRIRATLTKELGMIERLSYAPYFLTVHDIVRHARSLGILCQGRGSAANSAVCYCLGITAVDPTEIDLLFERFVSAERREPPDIDVDFEHERREEVIQYIYQRYGRDRAGIAATVIHYRPKMAAREVGKVMGLSADATAALSAESWNASGSLWSDDRLAEIGLDPHSGVVRRTVALARQLIGFPRHLSQHVGGFVLTKGRLDETVPIGPAAMAGRSFIEWDKDDIDALGIMKVDVLALGMLTCIHRAFDLLTARGLQLRDLADVPREDPLVYRMLSAADSLGVFQVESRAQMNMLPRLRPAKFYDLVIEVAIVRPGPIQGDMVHPYLRRRQGLEEVQFPSPHPDHGPGDELERVLGKTLGVPLFQEQAMRIAIEAARFTPEQANQLRRAMATFRHVGTIQTFFEQMVGGMVSRGYERDFAERCFRQIEGFGTYGFPESHAASFALLVYVSAWLKCHHPAAFACALLNSQPMGFYAPAQIIGDARAHGASVRAADINDSHWDSHLDADATLRLGFRQITGFRRDWAESVIAHRPFQDFAAVAAARLPHAALVALADADAFRSLGLDRRAALWQVRGLDQAAPLPLFAALPVQIQPAELPAMALPEQVAADYQSTGLSLKAHPLRFLRSRLSQAGLVSCATATGLPNGKAFATAGVVLVRQRPGSAGGVVFATIEDETGTANVVVWPGLLQTYRSAILGAAVLEVRGQVQRTQEGIVHLVAEHLADRTRWLHETDETATAPPAARADELPPAPHGRVAIHVPKSRDFR